MVGKNKTKKILIPVLLLAVCMLFAACGKEKTGNGENAGNSENITFIPGEIVVETIEPKTDFVSEEDYKKASPWQVCNNNKIAEVMAKAESGDKVTIAVLGGSITQGTLAKGTKDTALSLKQTPYADIFFEWWKEYFPNTEIVTVNAGIGGTNSYLGVHRVEEDVLSYKPDLVLIEYSVNDGADFWHKKSYENLVRRLLKSEECPALMLLFMAQTNGTSAQSQHVLVGFNYELPMVSYADVMKKMLADETYTKEDLSGDGTHPSALGHAIVGELLWKYLNNVYESYKMSCCGVWEAPAIVNGKPLTKDCYLDSCLLSADDIEPVSYGAFYRDDTIWSWPSAWTTKTGEDSIVFKTRFRNLGLLFYKTTTGKPGKYDVYVDGVKTAAINADFTNGWGSYAYSQEVFVSGEGEDKEHTVEIKLSEDSEGTELSIIRLMVSH
ncbi:MAG: SGNH/GDSL hydrolase family protein [Lachnospiraceae bacterium]|nr:SGNH/GDSL hydrolase family protein [Lachnospiraceae bacterium]